MRVHWQMGRGSIFADVISKRSLEEVVLAVAPLDLPVDVVEHGEGDVLAVVRLVLVARGVVCRGGPLLDWRSSRILLIVGVGVIGEGTGCQRRPAGEGRR